MPFKKFRREMTGNWNMTMSELCFCKCLQYWHDIDTLFHLSILKYIMNLVFQQMSLFFLLCLLCLNVSLLLGHGEKGRRDHFVCLPVDAGYCTFSHIKRSMEKKIIKDCKPKMFGIAGCIFEILIWKSKNKCSNVKVQYVVENISVFCFF